MIINDHAFLLFSFILGKDIIPTFAMIILT